jgi:hypothetical protein
MAERKHDEDCMRRKREAGRPFFCTCGLSDAAAADRGRKVQQLFEVIGAPFAMWCQGGPANGWRCIAMMPPRDEIVLWPVPHSPGEWLRVPPEDEWPGAVTYVRVRAVEQIDGECIYYPKDPA